MAETDSTRSSASGVRRQDDDESTAGAAGPGAPADRADRTGASAVAQPDLSRARDDDAEGPADGGAETPAGGGADAPSDGGADTPSDGGADTPSYDRPGTPSDGGPGTPSDGGPETRVSTAVPAAPPPEATTESHAHAAGDGVRPSSDGSSKSSESSESSDSPASTVNEPSTDTAALSVRPPDSEAARRAAAREKATAAKPALARFLQVAVALFFPIIVVAAAVRAVATSSFLWLEYHRPGFPADQYGFSLDDRMTYGSYALDYVLNFAPPRYLGGLVTPEGEPLFLESEVGHMADVKGVLGLSFFIALVLFVLAVLACAYLARRYRGGVRRALFAGAVLTLVGIAVLTVLAVLAWETFFTQVHALFFADGTWTFRVDDTLIRLFPEQFWTDSAVTVAVLVLGATILTLILTWPTRARRERSRRSQEAAQARYREALEAS